MTKNFTESTYCTTQHTFIYTWSPAKKEEQKKRQKENEETKNDETASNVYIHAFMRTHHVLYISLPSKVLIIKNINTIFEIREYKKAKVKVMQVRYPVHSYIHVLHQYNKRK